MALIDLNRPVFDPLPKTFRDSEAGKAVPVEALARLAVLHGQARRSLQLLQFLARAPRACLALILAGALVLVWASYENSSATLQADFVWSLWVLTGIVAMTVIYIRGFARYAEFQPLETAVSELRKFLLYTGLAWGLGAFAVMPDQPGALLATAFALVPASAVALILRDEIGALAFVVPATFLTASAAVLRTWPHGLPVAAVTFLAGAAIVRYSMLQCAIWRRRNSFPDLTLG